MYSANLNDIDFIKNYNVKLIAIHTSELQNHYEKYLELKNKGFFIFVYSSNEINFIKKYQEIKKLRNFIQLVEPGSEEGTPWENHLEQQHDSAKSGISS